MKNSPSSFLNSLIPFKKDSKQILDAFHFSEQEQFDIFHVLMHEGGFCDCEILYNVFRDSEYAQKRKEHK